MSENETKHSPLPWRFRPVFDDDSGKLIALFLETADPSPRLNDPVIMAIREDWIGYVQSSPRGMADASLLINAVNSHGALVFAVQELLTECNQFDVPQWDENEEHGPTTTLGKLRAALDGEVPLKGGGATVSEYANASGVVAALRGMLEFWEQEGKPDRMFPAAQQAKDALAARSANATQTLVEACKRVRRAIEWSVTEDRMTDKEMADTLRAALESAGECE